MIIIGDSDGKIPITQLFLIDVSAGLCRMASDSEYPRKRIKIAFKSVSSGKHRSVTKNKSNTHRVQYVRKNRKTNKL